MTMTVASGDAANNAAGQGSGGVPVPPGGVDVEGRPASVFRGVSGVQQWKRDDWMKKGLIVFRALALLFSFLSFVLIVSLTGFNTVEAYNYVLSIAIIAMVYTAVQTGIKISELCTGKSVMPPEVATWVDFCSDQIMAYFLLSSASAATSMVNYGRQLLSAAGYSGDPSVDHASAAISMSYLAFISMAPAALISGYYLAAQLSA